VGGLEERDPVFRRLGTPVGAGGDGAGGEVGYRATGGDEVSAVPGVRLPALGAEQPEPPGRVERVRESEPQRREESAAERAGIVSGHAS